MGTSLLKPAALLGALFIAIPPAHSAGVGVGSSTGAAGSTTSGAGIGTGTIGTMPGTISPMGRPGTSLSPSMGTPAPLPQSSFSGLSSPGLAGQGAATANQGANAGLTTSEQSLLMNFGASTPSGSTGGRVTPAEQMQSNAQANSDAAARSGTSTLLAPNGVGTSATGAVNGSATGSAGASTAGVTNGLATGSGAPATTTGTITTAPTVSPPVANNPGTLAETVQPGTP